MKYNIVIESHETHLYFKVAGWVHVENIFGLQEYIYSAPEYQTIRKAIFDFSDMILEEDQTVTSVAKMAMKNISDHPFEEPSKVAIVGNAEKVEKLVIIYIEMLKNSPTEFKYFAEVTDAKNWLIQ